MRDGNAPLNELFNELGNEGWELISAQVLQSSIFSMRGMEEVSQPVSQRWVFKRER